MMPKARRVLGVSKLGPDYLWFFMMADGMETVEVPDSCAIWTVDDNTNETTVVVTRTRRDGCFELKRVRIVGPRNEIANLMVSLGIGTPETPSVPYWQKTGAEEIICQNNF